MADAEQLDSPLARSVTWRAAVLLSVGTALLVVVSLGPMAEELGPLSWVVWSVTAMVGAVQCLFIAELARRWPAQAGGTATYAHLELERHAPLLAGLSSWGYWFAWTPGIAVNAILAAEYLGSAVDVDGTLPLALVLVAGLYAVNYAGLRASARLYVVVAVVAVVPLAAILVGALADPDELDFGALGPLTVPGGLLSAAGIALVLKWAFVAVWSSYGAEIASTVVAEMADPVRKVGRAMAAAAVTCVIAFTVIPVVLFALVGTAGLTEDPAVVLLDPAEELFGTAGSRVVAVMLAAALLLGAQAFVVGSSRTVFQMARDRHVPALFGRVSRQGVPVGSLAFDVVVILVLLVIFGDGVVDIVASANLGYVVVFILLPITYLLARRSTGQLRSGRDLARGRHLAAVAMLLVNTVLLVGGAPQWGWTVMLTGAAVLSLIVPLHWLARRQPAEAAGPGTGPPAAAVSPDRS
jgi:amino acid transporter